MQAVAVLLDKVQAVLVAVVAEALAVSGRGLSRQVTEHCILGVAEAAEPPPILLQLQEVKVEVA
jgi:hypothetical protein